MGSTAATDGFFCCYTAAATAAQMGSSAAIAATAAQMGSSAAIAATAAQMGSAI
jgi:hypothetical protein